MAKLSKDELIEKVRKYAGDRKDDETIEIIEDISDSIDSSEADEWKKKYEENDKMWRDKYISRFVEKKEDELDTPTEHEEKEKEYKSFEDLFEEEEE
nr:MAG TPA: hypothetical protein [Caudoviricetes sp.]